MMKTAFIKKKTRKKPSTPLPQTLEWKRILILPTRFGLLFVILIAGMLIGSINYNNNLGFFTDLPIREHGIGIYGPHA